MRWRATWKSAQPCPSTATVAAIATASPTLPSNPIMQLDATDWPGLLHHTTGPQLGWLTSECPLLQITCLMQCSTFHACAYSGDSEFMVTAVWTGPVPDRASFDALHADVDFAGEKEVVAERCLQAEAALSRSLQLNHGRKSQCCECRITPIVGVMFVASDDDDAAALCDACYHKQPRPGYVVSLRAWLQDAEAHPTHQPATLDDSPVVRFFHDQPPSLHVLSVRDLFLNREPSGAANGGGVSKRARAALQEWLQEPVPVDPEQGDWSSCHMYDEMASEEQSSEQKECNAEAADKSEKKALGKEELVMVPSAQEDETRQQRRAAVGRLLAVYWQSVLNKAHAAAMRQWRRTCARRVAGPSLSVAGFVGRCIQRVQ